MWNKTENVSRQNPGRPAPPPKQAAGYDDVFDRVEHAEAYDRSPYVEPGVYPLLYVDVVKMIKNRKGDDLFIIEFDILESQVPTRPKGSRMFHSFNFRHEGAPRDIKQFLATVMGVPLEEVDAQGAKYSCSAENPCHGRLIHLEAWVKKSTRTGNDFTVCRFSPIGADVQSRAEQLRGEAGFPTF